MDNLIEGNHLREYIYIDNIEINSILAQLYRGLNIKTTSSTSKSEELLKPIVKAENYPLEEALAFLF